MDEHPVSETQTPQILSPSSSVKNSPEFEFWMVRNPSFPNPNLLSADELIVDGVLLPLHLVSHSDNNKPPEPEPDPDPKLSQPGPGPEPAAVSSASKRWREIFKMGEKKSEDKKKEKKKDRKSSVVVGGGVSSATELNINIWPFSRSWSAGTGGNRSKTGSGPLVSRKVSSAPCSRSNSSGESKSRKWPSSPSRNGGIHLGRNSPVWQVRRGSGLRSATEPAVQKESVGASKVAVGVNGKGGRVLNLNVPMTACIGGYRQQLSCRADENVLLGGGGGKNVGVGGASNSGGGGGNKFFYLRTLFTKKVY